MLPTQNKVVLNDGTELDGSVVKVMRTIRSLESSGDYNAVGDNGTSYGAYQWNNGKTPLAPGQLPVNFVNAAKKYGLNPNDFSKANQNKVAYNQIKEYKDQGLSPLEIDALWNGARKDPSTGRYIHNAPERRIKFQRALQEEISQKQQTPQPQTDTSDTFSALFSDLAKNAYNQPKETAIGALEGALQGGVQSFVNLPSSAAANILGIADLAYSLATDPQGTLYTFGQAAYGGLENLAGVEGETASKNVANQFGQAIFDRYGTPGNLQRTAATDPLGLGADVLSVGAGGAALAGRGASALRGVSAAARPITAPLGEATRAVTNPIADYMMSPLRGMADTDAIAAARRVGADLPAGAMTTSPTIRYIEQLAQTGLGAEKYAAKVTSAIDQLETKASDIIKSTGGLDDITEAGRKISEGLDDFNKRFRKTNEALYGALQQKYGEVAATANKAVDAIDSIIANKKAIGDLEGIKFFETKRQVLSGGKGYTKPTLTTLRKVKTDLGEKIDKAFGDPFTTQNKKQLKQMLAGVEASIGDTIRSTGDAGALALYLKANKFYSDGIREITSSFGKTIKRLADEGKYDKIATGLVKGSTSIEDIPRILALIGEEGANNVRSSVVQSILKEARNAEGDFRPQGIQMAMKKWQTADGKSKLSRLLTPGQIQGLEDVGTLSRVLADAQAIAGGSKTAFLLKNLAQGGVVASAFGALMTGNLLGFMAGLAAAGLPEVGSLFLASNKGQQLLKLGIEKGSTVKDMAQKLGVWQASWNSTALGLTGAATADTVNLNEYNPTSGSGLLTGPNNNPDSGGGAISGVRMGDGQLPGGSSAGGVRPAGDIARSVDELAKEKGFNISAARDAGYTDEEIRAFLEQQ